MSDRQPTPDRAEHERDGRRIVNDEMTGRVHRDRVLLTGDSPLASDELGQRAAKALTGAEGYPHPA